MSERLQVGPVDPKVMTAWWALWQLVDKGAADDTPSIAVSSYPLGSWDQGVAPWSEVGLAPPDRAHRFRLVIGRAFDAVVVTVGGEIDAAGSEVLGGTLRDLVEGQGNLFLVVDLADAVVADPAALEVLATVRRSLASRDGRLLLARPSPDTGDALRGAGLGDAIELHPERRHHPSTRPRPRG